MGQIKNIKLHIVTDIKARPVNMDVELNSEEFALGDIVDDIQMSDDELEKELKQLENEKDEEKPAIVAEVKTTGAHTSDTANGHSEKKSDEVKTDNPDTNVKSRCEIYDQVDEPYDESYHYNRDRRHNNNKGRYGQQRRGHFGDDSEIDFNRLNRSLHISSTTDDVIVGREVAYRLHEEKTRLFGHVVRVLGKRTTSDIFAETKEIVNKGGLKTEKGDRMRTPGGTFLYLMKSRGYATPEQVKEIFQEDNAAKKKAKKRQRDTAFVKFCENEDLRKEQGDLDGQPRPKKKTKKSRPKSKENKDDSGDVESSQENMSSEKDLGGAVANSVGDSLVNTTTPKKETDVRQPSLSEQPPADEQPPDVEQEPGDLEDGEID